MDAASHSIHPDLMSNWEKSGSLFFWSVVSRLPKSWFSVYWVLNGGGWVYGLNWKWVLDLHVITRSFDELRKDALDAICALAVALGTDFAVFVPSVRKPMQRHHIQVCVFSCHPPCSPPIRSNNGYIRCVYTGIFYLTDVLWKLDIGKQKNVVDW